MRSAWVMGLGVLMAVTACSGQGGSDEKPTPSHRAEGIHHWTAAPCSLFRGKKLAEGFTVGYSLDVADSGTQTDVGADGKQWPYHKTTCTMQVVDAQQRIWNLDAAADIYDKAGPACSAHRVHEDLDGVALQENPWLVWAERVGSVVSGRVTKLVPSGAFVGLDDGIAGLIHNSELLATAPGGEVRVGEVMTARIAEVDPPMRRIRLSPGR